MEQASSTKIAAKVTSTHGVCSTAESIVPDSPAAIPAAA